MKISNILKSRIRVEQKMDFSLTEFKHFLEQEDNYIQMKQKDCEVVINRIQHNANNLKPVNSEDILFLKENLIYASKIEGFYTIRDFYKTYFDEKSNQINNANKIEYFLKILKSKNYNDLKDDNIFVIHDKFCQSFFQTFAISIFLTFFSYIANMLINLNVSISDYFVLFLLLANMCALYSLVDTKIFNKYLTCSIQSSDIPEMEKMYKDFKKNTGKDCGKTSLISKENNINFSDIFFHNIITKNT